MSEIQIELDAANHRTVPKLLVDGHKVEVRGLNFRAEAGHIPTLEVELRVMDSTRIGAAHVEVLIDPTTSGYLERAGWTPPPGTGSVLFRDEDGCPCEYKDVGDEGNPRKILGHSVPTCPVHGSTRCPAT